jgi:hypothetical protein
MVSMLTIGWVLPAAFSVCSLGAVWRRYQGTATWADVKQECKATAIALGLTGFLLYLQGQ